jgi:MoaA/NifB/PqqE/SkfB family radical SAM enzyme
MMRFPLRLTADLAMARFARNSRLALDSKPVQFVGAAEILHHDSNHPVSHEKIREIIASRSPVVWIGGSEPLHHPGISHLVRAIIGSGHFVFLETDGTLLRPRIHEFQPVSRLFLTVRMQSGRQRQTSKTLPANTWELAAEGIRAARLSGFLICVHARVRGETELGEMAGLVQFARSLDVDGIVISPANSGANSAHPDAAALRRKTAEARKLIGSKWWESFSDFIEPVVSGKRLATRSADETAVCLAQESHANEEGVRVA